MGRLEVPPNFKVPESTAHFEDLRAAYSVYQKHPEWWDSAIVDPEDFGLVCKYVDYYGDPAYRFIILGGIQGVSIIEHELTEMAWFYEHDYDPFGRLGQEAGADEQMYAVAHAHGLIAEHRYLQNWASADGKDFLLGELIRWNPGSGRPAADLKYVLTHVHKHKVQEVSDDELQIREEQKTRVYAWYREQQFEGYYPKEMS